MNGISGVAVKVKAEGLDRGRKDKGERRKEKGERTKDKGRRRRVC